MGCPRASAFPPLPAVKPAPGAAFGCSPAWLPRLGVAWRRRLAVARWRGCLAFPRWRGGLTVPRWFLAVGRWRGFLAFPRRRWLAVLWRRRFAISGRHDLALLYWGGSAVLRRRRLTVVGRHHEPAGRRGRHRAPGCRRHATRGRHLHLRRRRIAFWASASGPHEELQEQRAKLVHLFASAQRLQFRKVVEGQQLKLELALGNRSGRLLGPCRVRCCLEQLPR